MQTQSDTLADGQRVIPIYSLYLRGGGGEKKRKVFITHLYMACLCSSTIGSTSDPWVTVIRAGVELNTEKQIHANNSVLSSEPHSLSI